VAHVADCQRPDLGEAQAQQPEPDDDLVAQADDDLVAQADDGPVLAGGDEIAVGLVMGEPAAAVFGLDLAVGAPAGKLPLLLDTKICLCSVLARSSGWIGFTHTW